MTLECINYSPILCKTLLDEEAPRCHDNDDKGRRPPLTLPTVEQGTALPSFRDRETFSLSSTPSFAPKGESHEQSNLNHSSKGEQGGGFYCYLVMQQLLHQEEENTQKHYCGIMTSILRSIEVIIPQ